MRMKVSVSCTQIFLHIGSNFNGTFVSFTFLINYHCIDCVNDQNSCYWVIKFIDSCEGMILFTIESVH